MRFSSQLFLSIAAGILGGAISHWILATRVATLDSMHERFAASEIHANRVIVRESLQIEGDPLAMGSKLVANPTALSIRNGHGSWIVLEAKPSSESARLSLGAEKQKEVGGRALPYDGPFIDVEVRSNGSRTAHVYVQSPGEISKVRSEDLLDRLPSLRR